MTQQLILIRPPEQSLALLDVLAEHLGYAPDAIISPLMKIEPIDIDLPKNMQIPFVFTSQNAVRIAAPLMSQRGTAVCVGARVAQLAHDAGFTVSQTFETASQLLDQCVPKGTYLRAEQVSTEINTAARLDEFVIYRQAPLEMRQHALRSIENGAVVPVYSEYAAKRLLECLDGNGENTTVICISDKVAASLSHGNFAQIYTATHPTSAAMIKTIIKRL
jgi:uroporphyrinogen-III synthase